LLTPMSHVAGVCFSSPDEVEINIEFDPRPRPLTSSSKPVVALPENMGKGVEYKCRMLAKLEEKGW